MQTKNIKQSVILPCTPQEVYNAWLDSKTHGEMVNGSAKIDPKVGGKFLIWNGDISGKTIELHPDDLKIVQSWRENYDDWPDDYFSVITLQFTPHKNSQTKMLFSHSGIPAKFARDINEGWKTYYWEPMKQYFMSKKHNV